MIVAERGGRGRQARLAGPQRSAHAGGHVGLRMRSQACKRGEGGLLPLHNFREQTAQEGVGATCTG
jgi:hypothetical protein